MRKVFLVNKPFQIKFISFLTAVGLVSVISTYLVQQDNFAEFAKFANRVGIGPEHPFRVLMTGQKEKMNLYFVLLTAFNVLVAMVCGLWISHRIAGPIYRIVQDLKFPNSRPKDRRFKTRKDDYFQELSEAMQKSAPEPANERERLSFLNELDILDTFDEQAYDDLTFLAATICDCPIGLVSFIDKEREWFKSHIGLDVSETPRKYAFSAHAILDDKIFVVPDASKDPRFAENPMVTGAPQIAFYAGMPLTMRNGLRVGTLCVIDHKPRELTHLQLNAIEAIGRQAVALLELRLKIKEQMAVDKMKTEFVAMVSHELRTPLTSLYGSLKVVQAGSLKGQEERIGKLVDVSTNNAERLINIVNDILDLTKIESGKFSINRSEGDVVLTVNESIDHMQAYFQKCGVTVQTTFENTPLTANFDQGRIMQVLNNLLSNAAKFSNSGGVVEVLARRSSGEIQITIKDTGVGIPEEAQENIFQKFSKAAGIESKNLPGTGLGLAITKTLVELHGGRIWFTSKTGEGTTFHFTLPVA